MKEDNFDKQVFLLVSEHYWLCKQYQSAEPLSHERSVCERRANAVRDALRVLGYDTNGKPLFEMV